MANPKFIHNYTDINNRPVHKEPQDSSKTKTERAGYMSMEKRITSIMAAGQRLDASRREQFHFGDDNEVDLNFNDHSIDPSLDIVDIHSNVQQDQERILTKVTKAQAKAQAKAKAKEAIARAAEIAKSDDNQEYIKAELLELGAENARDQLKILKE